MNLCASAIVLSFIPLEDAWIFAFSASPLLSETEVRLTSPSHLKWKSKLGTSHMTSESNVKLQQGVWINRYQLWHFLSVSIASWCLELNCWADELGPLSQEDRRLSYISVWTLTMNWVDQIIPESDSTTAISNSDDKNTLWLVGMFSIILLPMMSLETYVFHGLLKFWRLVPFSACILHSLDPFVYIVSNCFGNVFIIKHDEIGCSITKIYF